MPVFEVHNVGVVRGGEAFLIVTDGKTALVDSGFAFTAKRVVSNIKAILGDRPLDYILLTHSHYDHVSGVSACKRHWKNAKIVSLKHAADVFEKKSAMEHMRVLNHTAVRNYRMWPFFIDDMKYLHTDMIVRGGDIIDLGAMKLKVIEAPGHTWDSIGFWCEEEKFMITCETTGVITSEESVMPACLVCYKTTIDFILLQQQLAPEKMLVPHYGMIEGDLCRKYLDNALTYTQRFKDAIVKGYREGKSEEDLKAYAKELLYQGVVREGQPEAAFDFNNKYMVPMIIKECCEDRR